MAIGVNLFLSESKYFPSSSLLKAWLAFWRAAFLQQELIFPNPERTVYIETSLGLGSSGFQSSVPLGSQELLEREEEEKMRRQEIHRQRLAQMLEAKQRLGRPRGATARLKVEGRW